MKLLSYKSVTNVNSGLEPLTILFTSRRRALETRVPPQAEESKPCSNAGFGWCRSPASWLWRFLEGWSQNGRPGQAGRTPSPVPRQGDTGSRPAVWGHPPPTCADTATARLFLGESSCYLRTLNVGGGEEQSEKNTDGGKSHLPCQPVNC